MSNSKQRRQASLVEWIFPVVGILVALFLAWGVGQLQNRETQLRNDIPKAYGKIAKENVHRACIGLENSAAFECIYDEIETSQAAANIEQDLSAQQRAASSALISAIVSIVTLALSAAGLWYVKGTLEATRDAVADTSEATREMVRSNNIALHSQRPWISIGADIGSFSLTERRSLHASFNINFRNTGGMIATDFQTRIRFAPMDENAHEIIPKWRDAWISEIEAKSSVLVPNEEAYAYLDASNSIEFLPWFGESEPKIVFLVLMIGAFYRIPEDQQWRHYLRTFSVGLKGDPFRASAFASNFPDGAGLDDIVFKRFGMSYAN